MALLFFKDRFEDEEKPLIQVNDRSFRFGDGVFETILVAGGQLYEFETHLRRLKNGLEAFKINYATDAIEKICLELIEKNNLKDGYLRLIVSRGVNGPGAIGYKPKAPEPYLVVQAIEKTLAEFKSIKVWLSSYKAYYSPVSKINSALHYSLSMIEAEENSCDNALITNAEGIVCETANANLFWFRDGKLHTPSLDLPLIPGTVRKRIFDLYQEEIIETHTNINELKNADEVFMSNIGGLVTGIEAIQPLGYIYKSFDQSLKLRKLIQKDIEKTISFCT